MQAPNKMMDVHITFGKKDNLQDLADVQGVLTTDTNEVNKIIQQSKFNDEIGEDAIVVFHFYTEQGKEEEGLKYFQDAINPDIQQDKKTPLQILIRDPIHQGKLQIIKGQGCIIIKYRFFLQSNPELGQMDPILGNYQIPKVNIELCMKGFLSHNKKNRTNVKVDYADFKLNSDIVKPSQLLSFMQQIDALNQNQITNPLVQLIGKTKSAQIKMKFLSFRSIMGYYNKAANPSKQKQTKQFNYTNQGIFRKQATFFTAYKNKIAIKFDGTYNGEDVFIRLVKVYSKFIFNGF